MSRVIFKMSFKHPNLNSTKSKNISHVEYISTRPGVDKTLTESDLKKELEKGIEDISDNETYSNYIDKRPRSQGLFGQDGLENLDEVKKELENAKSFVWRGIVSVKEDDALKLGYLDKEKWQMLLRKQIPDMADKMGIPIDNLRWVGAVHMEKGHPHAHIMMWEKEPLKIVGIVKSKTLDDIRKSFTDEIFEDERLSLLNEKNAMRDLIRDIAKDDISKVTELIKEIKESGLELQTFISLLHHEGITPKLYSDQEKALVEMLHNLSSKMSGKGRINYKFMSDDVKEEVNKIADYLFKQPELNASVEKSLKAVEELTKLYTGKVEDIEKARQNTYDDLRKRVCQVILKGAVEIQRKNIFYVDEELSNNAVNFIKNMDNKINLSDEYTKTLTKLSNDLKNAKFDTEDIKNILCNYAKNENIPISENNISAITKFSDVDNYKRTDMYSLNGKNLDSYISSFKIAGMNEDETFKNISNIIDKTNNSLVDKLKNENDIFINDGNNFSLSDKGIEELLKIKELQKDEKYIFKFLDNQDNPVSFKELLNDKNIFDNLYNKEFKPFNLGKFDTAVRGYFGDNNILSLKELEEKLFNKYTDDNFNCDKAKAEQEFDILKNRIDKLTLNGFVKYDKLNDTYTFTDEAKNYFSFDPKKERYNLTPEAINKFNVPAHVECSLYDVNVTFKYIENTDSKEISQSDLKTAISKEIKDEVEADKHFKYINWRMNELKDQGYLKYENNVYSLTDKGIEKKEDILTPEKQYLKSTLNYLNKLGLINLTDDGYVVSEKYHKFCNDIQAHKDSNIERKSECIDKSLYKIIEQFQGNINTLNIKINAERMATGKYINNVYDDVKTNYSDVRNTYNIKDTTSFVVNKLSTALLVSGISIDEVKTILNDWISRTDNQIDKQKLDENINSAYESFKDNNDWKKTTIISSKDWKELFHSLGVNDNDIPKWIYKGENWEQFNKNNHLGFSMINNLWKGIWSELEKERMITKAQAEYMKKNLIKQQAISNNLEAMKQEAKKNKSNTLYQEDELEL